MGRQADDGAAEPFEIVKAVADKISEHAAAFVAQRLPVFQAHARPVVLDVPVDVDVAQAADRALLDQGPGAFPAQYLAEAEIDRRGTATGLRSLDHALGAGQIRRHWLFREDGFAALEREDRYRRLQMGSGGDRDGVDARAFDKIFPGIERQRNV